ncbi:hypothetical protein [Xanthomonas campestris]|uniref:hypothetical protein n=1 Tax=Xanthomonas campestris TaxID=339 RepID=UPI00388EFA7C
MDKLQLALGSGDDRAALVERRAVLQNTFNEQNLLAVRAQCGIGATVKNPNGKAD